MNKVRVTEEEAALADTQTQGETSVPVETGLAVSVIVPTYHEAENLQILLPRIQSVLDQAGMTGQIIVVDDDSNDGTDEVCQEHAIFCNVILAVRKGRRGLASAVVEGMQRASGDILVVMDADLSHPPESIPDLVRALDNETTDFVIGSRYAAGGAVDGDWGALRWLNSKVATWLARPLTSVSDPMAGFFAIRKQAFLTARELNPVGYKIGLELIVKCKCRNVREIPIQFSSRHLGASKMGLRQQFQYLRHLGNLYSDAIRQLHRPIRFFLVGATGMVVDLVLFALLVFISPFQIARAVSIWAAMTWNYCLNRRITFPESETHTWAKSYVLFCLSCLVGGLVNWLVSVYFCATVPFFERWPVLAAICGIVSGALVNYGLCKRIVFSRRGRLLDTE